MKIDLSWVHFASDGWMFAGLVVVCVAVVVGACGPVAIRCITADRADKRRDALAHKRLDAQISKQVKKKSQKQERKGAVE